jgi:hypothetical protein
VTQSAPDSRIQERTDAATRAAVVLRVLVSGAELSRRDIEDATGLNQVAVLRTSTRS